MRKLHFSVEYYSPASKTRKVHSYSSILTKNQEINLRNIRYFVPSSENLAPYFPQESMPHKM